MVKLRSTFTFDFGKTYFLVNCGNSDIYLIDTTDNETTLNAKKINGIRLTPYGQVGLKKRTIMFIVSAIMELQPIYILKKRISLWLVKTINTIA